VVVFFAETWIPRLQAEIAGSFIINANAFKGNENNKQLLDEVEHDIVNYQNRGLCYLPKPKAYADNTDTRF